MGGLVDRAEAAGDEGAPDSAGAANRLLGLDATSPLRFADLEDDGQVRRTCVVSDDGTYLALNAGDQDLRVLLGDGACSYEPDAASVVGDLATGRWVKGADLMGGAEVGDVFPTITLDEDELSAGATPDAHEARLLLDAKVLATAVAQYAFEHRAYPAVPADDLADTLSAGGELRLGSRTRVFAYLHGPTGFALCLVDGQGSWARWNRLVGTSYGTYTSDEDLGRCAAPLATEGS